MTKIKRIIFAISLIVALLSMSILSFADIYVNNSNATTYTPSPYGYGDVISELICSNAGDAQGIARTASLALSIFARSSNIDTDGKPYYGLSSTTTLYNYDATLEVNIKGNFENDGSDSIWRSNIAPDEVFNGEIFDKYVGGNVKISLGNFSHARGSFPESIVYLNTTADNISWSIVINALIPSISADIRPIDNSVQVDSTFELKRYTYSGTGSYIDMAQVCNSICQREGVSGIWCYAGEISIQYGESVATAVDGSNITYAELSISTPNGVSPYTYIPRNQRVYDSLIPEIESETFYELGLALMGGVQAFFLTEITAGITFGTLFMAVITLILFKAGLNYFAGG